MDYQNDVYSRLLKHTDNIRRFLAAFTLLLFCFCVTPKRILHDLLANHRDTQTSTHRPFEEIAKSGFHCHIDDLVVVAPFLPAVQSVNTASFHCLDLRFSELIFPFSFVYPSGNDNRGPPVVCFS